MAEGADRRAARPLALAAIALFGIAGVASDAEGAPLRNAPRSRYDLANRCFAVASAPRRFVAIAGDDAYRAGASQRGAARFYLKPTALGAYLVYDSGGGLLTVKGGDTTGRVTTPTPEAIWAPQRVTRRSLQLKSVANGHLLAVGPDESLITGPGASLGRFTRFAFVRARGCRPYPEAALGATGRTFRGTRRDGTVRGYADAHLHVTADLRAGGNVIYGENYDPLGITEALGHDDAAHGPDGSLDVTGNLLRSGTPTGTHDTHGWPTFAGWPTYDTYTHQQVYYRWLQRAWMSGMRLVVAQLVEDAPLCNIEPLRSHSCDETETIELEARRLRGLQSYIDAQSGGPGRGWFRIVYTPRQARRAIRRGKLAILMGVEASNPFGCSVNRGAPQCDRAAIDRGISLYRRIGIRGMFITHWIDNAFAGAALEGGDKGAFIGTFEVQQTGDYFKTAPCPEAGQGEEVQPAPPDTFGPVLGSGNPVLGQAAPVYPPGKQCNSKGLTDLGAYLVRRLIANHMLIEADHLSERARLSVLKIAEEQHYPLISSHTGTGGFWTPSDLRRLYAIGGFATARPDSAAKLAAEIVRLRRYRSRGRYFGVGMGTDTGGFNALPGPDANAGQSPLHYPFQLYGCPVRFARERTGQRTFDVNRDGVAHYGLFPDLLADMQRRKDGRQAVGLLFRSAEAYLRTWQLAVS